MNGVNITAARQGQLECRVTKRSTRRELTVERMFQDLQRLGVSPSIVESLRMAQVGQIQKISTEEIPQERD